MQRREFCKLITAAAASTAVSAKGQAAASAPSGFNHLHQTYEEFCATPESQRVFYALVDGKIVEKKLNNSDWSPTAWGEPPELPGDSWDGVPMQSPVEGLNGEGPYQATWDSLSNYDAPEWYRDAKFGIWAHWSPQCVPEFGDWYARNMYEEGSPDYAYHKSHYGSLSRFGYKDLCAQWTLLNWEPEALIERYKTAGARLFIALANHHDGFDCWGSKHQPWNAVNHGPHRNVVGEWASAARKHGLRFGVTVHEARNWWWFQTSHGADKAGPDAGVSYDGRMTRTDGKGQWWDGLDPQMLYGPKHPKDALPDASYVKNFYDRTRDLIDQHDPDLLYFDNALLPLGWGGMNVGAYFYNHNLKTRGKMEAVLNIKNVPDKLAKAVVADYERGLTSGIMPYAWQSETCIGEWHYRRSLFEGPGTFGSYLPPRDAIHWLVDTVSKNGTFILNFPGKPDGTIDSKELAVLDEIAAWLKINGEAIFETRPWIVYGEGPNSVKSGPFQGASISAMGSNDIRFTRNKANNVIYAIFMGWPERRAKIESLGSSSKTNPGKIQNVTVVGSDAQVKWTQEEDALHIEVPHALPIANNYGAAVKIGLS
ncbi:MAG: alpha-L-fucosidase [Terracidiphilus sp.]